MEIPKHQQLWSLEGGREDLLSRACLEAKEEGSSASSPHPDYEMPSGRPFPSHSHGLMVRAEALSSFAVWELGPGRRVWSSWG